MKYNFCRDAMAIHSDHEGRCFNCMCLCDLILTGPGTQMSKMKVTVDKIISLSESDGVDELQKHFTLLSDDQVCVSVHCSEQSLCKLVSNHFMYKASPFKLCADDFQMLFCPTTAHHYAY